MGIVKKIKGKGRVRIIAPNKSLKGDLGSQTDFLEKKPGFRAQGRKDGFDRHVFFYPHLNFSDILALIAYLQFSIGQILFSGVAFFEIL